MTEDDNCALCDPEWEHLSVLYEILLEIVSVVAVCEKQVLSKQIDSTTRKHSITPSFLIRLISLFDSVDPRERECLKTVTHRIYGCFTNRRALIRKIINHTFYQFLYETHVHRGISELLEILASIINGFTVPIRPEHLQTLQKSLIPLHKMTSYEQYSTQLAYCMSLYVTKDHSLSTPVLSLSSPHSQIIKGILRYWPTGNSGKEICFINEIDDILQQLQPQEIRPFRDALFRRIAKCVKSPNFQVAERALSLWRGTDFDTIVMRDKENVTAVARIMYPALRECEKTINVSIKDMARHVYGLFVDHCFDVIDELNQQYDSQDNRA